MIFFLKKKIETEKCRKKDKSHKHFLFPFNVKKIKKNSCQTCPDNIYKYKIINTSNRLNTQIFYMVGRSRF